ncbi:hypothetical protein I3842_11G079100 [Carya illinoinensis]|uniref:Uncharacterized protein n=1 Tax=Carya illinoinensis TaxID=32201 RepID=A0A922IZM2_CARIL|nr:hypothetical protein I3842_11G079100 [Carya illinoinensis]
MGYLKPKERDLNVLSAAFYTLAATAIDPSSDSTYLLLNALIRLLTSIVSLIPILSQPSLDPLSPEEVHRDSLLFFIYVLFGTSNSDTTTARLLFSGAIALLVVPLCIPGVVCAKDWFHRYFHSFDLQAGSSFILVDADDLEIHKELLSHHAGSIGSVGQGSFHHSSENGAVNGIKGQKLVGEIRDQLTMLGNEHPARIVVRGLDFWLYYLAYFCGGQIAQSLGQCSENTTLLTLYSSFSFFGRLLSAAPDYIPASGNGLALHVGTSLVALSSGLIFAVAVSITWELFGPNSVGVNHNILITNIPIGSLVYGCVATVVYDANTSSESAVCIGRQCFVLTFVWWGCMSVLGLTCSVLLFLRTRHAYNQFQQNRVSTQLY